MAKKNPRTQADAWNERIPVGTLVSYEEIKGEGETHRAKTRSEAWVMGGHSAMVLLEGKSGGVRIDHCKPVIVPAGTVA